MLGKPGTGKHAGVDTMSNAGNRVLAGKVADAGLIEFPIQGHVLLATGIRIVQTFTILARALVLVTVRQLEMRMLLKAIVATLPHHLTLS